MKARTTTIAIALGALVTFAHGGGDPMPAADDLLTAMDFVPDRADLDRAMGPSTLDQLLDKAEFAPDVGVRLRALRALAQYPSPEAHDLLVRMVADPGAASDERDFVLQRAALESLGEIGTPDDVAVITPYLYEANAPHPDTRAAAAHALRVLGSTLAVPTLQERREVEESPQVVVAIIEALRALLGGT